MSQVGDGWGRSCGMSRKKAEDRAGPQLMKGLRSPTKAFGLRVPVSPWWAARLALHQLPPASVENRLGRLGGRTR